MGELSSLRLLRCAADFFCPWDVTWPWLLNQEHPMPYPERSKKTWAAHMGCRTVKWTVVNLVYCSSTTTTEPSCCDRCFFLGQPPPTMTDSTLIYLSISSMS